MHLRWGGTCFTHTLSFKVPFPAVRLHQEHAMCDCQYKPHLIPAIIEPRGMEYIYNTRNIDVY